MSNSKQCKLYTNCTGSNKPVWLAVIAIFAYFATINYFTMSTSHWTTELMEANQKYEDNINVLKAQMESDKNTRKELENQKKARETSIQELEAQKVSLEKYHQALTKQLESEMDAMKVSMVRAKDECTLEINAFKTVVYDKEEAERSRHTLEAEVKALKSSAAGIKEECDKEIDALKAKHYDNAKSQQDAFTVALEAGKREREQIDAEVEELESQIESFYKQKSDSSN